MNKFFAMLLTMVLLLQIPMNGITYSDYSRTEVYPVYPGMVEWDLLETVDNKKEACKISEELLTSMTTDELIYAVVDYPFLVDLFVCDDYELPVNVTLKECDALKELANRENAVPSMINFLKENYSDNNVIMTDIEEYKLEAIMILLSYSEIFSQKLSCSDIDYINSQSHLIRLTNMTGILRLAYVYTPRGTQVSCETFACSHASNSYHSSLDNQLAYVYGVTLISPGSCRYNCHSYAWYSTSTNNSIWINNPYAFMSDGSYSLVLSGMNSNSSSVSSGQKICYGSSSAPLHSARVTSSASSVTLGNRIVKSKWGSNGVFEHKVSTVPTEYLLNNSISAWALA